MGGPEESQRDADKGSSCKQEGCAKVARITGYGRLNVDPGEVMVRFHAAVASQSASATFGFPAVNVGPPQWMHNALAKVL